MYVVMPRIAWRVLELVLTKQTVNWRKSKQLKEYFFPTLIHKDWSVKTFVRQQVYDTWSLLRKIHFFVSTIHSVCILLFILVPVLKLDIVNYFPRLSIPSIYCNKWFDHGG